MESRLNANRGFTSMDEMSEERRPTGPGANLKEITIDVPPPASPDLTERVASGQTASQSLTSSSAEPDQQRTEMICPLCGCQHVRRSPRRGPIEHLRSFFGFYPYRCLGCSSRSFLRTSLDLLPPKRTTGLIEQFLEILGLRTHRWHDSLSRFLHLRKWLRKRRRPSDRRRREMLLYGGGIVVFLALFSLLIWVMGRK
jgi:hypothetical protein